MERIEYRDVVCRDGWKKGPWGKPKKKIPYRKFDGTPIDPNKPLSRNGGQAYRVEE